MVAPIKKTSKKVAKTIPKKKKTLQQRKPRKHKEYGTSKLEEKFAQNFLDKLKVKYVYQYKAESIGRYFDFYLPDCRVLLEIDGDYWHSYGVLYENMTPTQKRNRRVDEQKTHWALINGIPLYRIWEHDINKHPAEVMKRLKKIIGVAQEETRIMNEKKKRH